MTFTSLMDLFEAIFDFLQNLYEWFTGLFSSDDDDEDESE